MSTEESSVQDSDEMPLLINTLLTIPHLEIVCLDMHLLKELGSICRESRKWSRGRITRLTVDLGKSLQEPYIAELVSMLSQGKLCHISLVLYPWPEDHGE